jgi:Cytosolic carboxypeptidase N-terminal domain
VEGALRSNASGCTDPPLPASSDEAMLAASTVDTACEPSYRFKPSTTDVATGLPSARGALALRAAQSQGSASSATVVSRPMSDSQPGLAFAKRAASLQFQVRLPHGGSTQQQVRVTKDHARLLPGGGRLSTRKGLHRPSYTRSQKRASEPALEAPNWSSDYLKDDAPEEDWHIPHDLLPPPTLAAALDKQSRHAGARGVRRAAIMQSVSLGGTGAADDAAKPVDSAGTDPAATSKPVHKQQRRSSAAVITTAASGLVTLGHAVAEGAGVLEEHASLEGSDGHAAHAPDVLRTADMDQLQALRGLGTTSSACQGSSMAAMTAAPAAACALSVKSRVFDWSAWLFSPAAQLLRALPCLELLWPSAGPRAPSTDLASPRALALPGPACYVPSSWRTAQAVCEARRTSSRSARPPSGPRPSTASDAPVPRSLPAIAPLSFSSAFESGNLRAAVRTGPYAYDLFLCPDLNDISDFGMRCQWFYFSVAYAQPDQPYTFNIVNFNKKESLYSTGVLPLIACPSIPGALAPDSAAPAGGWHRRGSSVSYHPSPYRVPPQARTLQAATAVSRGAAATRKASAESATDKLIRSLGGRADAAGKGLYSLTFTMSFPTPDRFFIATCFPYTYTDLQKYLLRLAVDSSVEGLDFAGSAVLRRSLLCRTAAGNRCDLLTITDFTAGAEAVAQREVIVLTARVHPGESNASWVMQARAHPVFCLATECCCVPCEAALLALHRNTG